MLPHRSSAPLSSLVERWRAADALSAEPLRVTRNLSVSPLSGSWLTSAGDSHTSTARASRRWRSTKVDGDDFVGLDCRDRHLDIAVRSVQVKRVAGDEQLHAR